jgi:NADPH:quinone reductase-like Zn-dependent oxidoreductase
VKEKAEIVEEFTRKALPKFADRTIVPIVEKVFPLADIREAHRMMEEDRHFGKIVMKVS